MKHLCLPAVLLAMTLSAHAQQQRPRPYEVGADVLTYVPQASLARPQWQGPSGLFFRYAPHRVGLRVAAAYSRRITQEGSNCNDCPVGETTARALTLRAGGQYAPVRQLPWLYAFADAAYRRTLASGTYTGGFCGCSDFTETGTGQGWGAMAGLGASIGVLPRLRLVPELYYEGFRTRTAHVYVDNQSPYTNRYASWTKEHTPALRLLATVSF